jgi:hypothetical protein
VAVGFRISGEDDPGLKAQDIMVEGNSFFGLGQASVGVSVAQCAGFSLRNNQIIGFSVGLALSPVSGGAAFNGATRVFIEGNTITGGTPSFLYGNRGGSLANNRFHGQASHAVYLFAWEACNVTDNTFNDLGSTAVAWGIIVRNYAGRASTGNTFAGNRSLDFRETKWTSSPVVFQERGISRNFVHGNSAVAARPGTPGFQDLGRNTDNLVGQNFDAPASP